jgi:hypothetical protein
METASVRFSGEREYRSGTAKVERFYKELVPSGTTTSGGSDDNPGLERCELRFRADDEVDGDLEPEFASLDGRFEDNRVIEYERLNGRLFWLRVEQ